MEEYRIPVSFIATDNRDKTRTFYADIMGLELLESTPYALVFCDRDHLLRIQIVSEFKPAAYTVHGWQVANLADEIGKLVSKGVECRNFEHLTQDRLGIWTTPDGHKIAWFADPVGNVLSFTEYVGTK